MTKVISPYAGLASNRWRDKTKELIKKHPLKQNEIVEVVLKVWKDIVTSTYIRK